MHLGDIIQILSKMTCIQGTHLYQFKQPDKYLNTYNIKNIIQRISQSPFTQTTLQKNMLQCICND